MRKQERTPAVTRNEDEELAVCSNELLALMRKRIAETKGSGKERKRLKIPTPEKSN